MCYTDIIISDRPSSPYSFQHSICISFSGIILILVDKKSKHHFFQPQLLIGDVILIISIK